VALIGVFVLGGCERSGGLAEAQQAPRHHRTAQHATPQHHVTPQATAPQPPHNLSAAQIAAVLEVVNTAEIDQARLARTHARAANVRQYAEEMIRDHTQARDRNQTLCRERNIAPQPGDVTAQLRRDGEHTMGTLRAAHRNAFDRTYIEAQAHQHRDALALLDANIPNVTDQPYRTFLDEVRGTVDHHRQMAEQMLPTLSPTASR
jgi:putative membrane protein